MKQGFAAPKITRLAAGALALLLGAAPAAAEEASAVLTVSAIVAPACSVERGLAARHSVAVACSTGASVSTKTATRHDEQPLDEAAAILGAPLRRDGGVVFTAPVQPASAESSEPDQPRYLTITY